MPELHESSHVSLTPSVAEYREGVQGVIQEKSGHHEADRRNHENRIEDETRAEVHSPMDARHKLELVKSFRISEDQSYGGQ